MQALFQLDLNNTDESAELERYETLAIDTALGEVEEHIGRRDREYVQQLVHGVRTNLAEIDKIITECSKDWKVERMAVVDRNLTRIAIFEIRLAEEKLTPNIAINEAVELAKKYGTDDSGRYVNGILGAMMKQAQ